MAGQDNISGCTIESEQQFWDELSVVIESTCDTHELIDDALRGWLHLVSSCRDRFLHDEDDLASCSQKLIDSCIFNDHKDYVRTQIIYSLLQEDEFCPLHVIANFLLLDGRSDETTFRQMIDAGCFARLLDLMKECRDQDGRLHRLLLELMYEMSRIEHLRIEDLMHVDDAFVFYLFQLIEAYSDDAHDPYHYPVIRVLLVLNEQYMVAATTAAVDPSSSSFPLTNRVIKVLSVHGPHFRTFGENIILLLNRETETSLQLLILKLLYLLFTTKATYEYFYTNDLRVLLDVIIRNLLDLPNEVMALRHTYLRVLSPLLAHTQLSQPPHYKREEILKVLRILSGVGNAHFAPVDETTVRLVDRVAKVEWLAQDEEGSECGDGEVARKLLGISLSPTQSASSVSVVAGVTEKPGVKTPSRKTEFGPEVRDMQEAKDIATAANETTQSHAKSTTKPKKVLPEVPKHRHGLPMGPKTTVVHLNGGGQKKLPPKAPPPRRRTKLKAVTSSADAAVTPESLHPVS
ncbi:hypothetical protein BR93DRAFT_882620 [Coniochaeta sp. PMI_546]|nr:hypothetical protein BR93DRAFT_882620 [Coniochaeta sp. PMI_546]